MSTTPKMLLACTLACCTLLPAAARGQGPGAEHLLPNTTKLFLSLPDPDTARAKFNASQLGELVNHKDMAKFRADVQKQLEGSGRMAERLGIAPADLDGVYAGEVALAAIQPGGKHDTYATALIVKIRPGDPGKLAQAMLGKVVQRRLKEYGKDRCRTSFIDFDPDREKEVYRLTTPKVGDKPPISTYYFFQGSYFVAVDHADEARALYKRIAIVQDHGAKAAVDSLATTAPYRVSMAHVSHAWGHGQPQFRWFVDPLNFMRLRRAEQIDVGARKKERGRVMIDVYADEGFDAIQGIGGWVNFSADGHEVLHRSFIYAPAVDRLAHNPIVKARLATEAKMSKIPKGVQYAGDDNNKYFLGARILNFMNDGKLSPLGWLPDDLATHLTFHWQMQKAFKYSETLFNAYSDDVAHQEVWWGTIDSIRDDEDGPKVDVRKDIVMQLGTRATYITDYARPIDVDSERTAVALEIAGDQAKVSAALDAMMKNDPDAVAHKVGNRTVWEIVPPPPGKNNKGAGAADVQPVAYLVANGHLFRASHADILERMAAMPNKPLAEAADLRAVNAQLDKLSDGQESFRYFARLDRSLEQNWELIRQGKFPQSDSMLANAAARLQGFDPGDPKTKERKQEVDGKNLPKYAFAKKFLGPSGLFIKTERDGWMVTGVVLTKK